MKNSVSTLVNMNRTKPSFMKTNAQSSIVSLAAPTCACLLGLLALTPASRAADANPPDRLTYQGFLVNVTGTALGATAPKNYDVVFRIYDAQSGGNRLWTEQQTVTVDKGYFSVLLGEGTQVTSESHQALATLFADASASDRYVETTVKGIAPGGADSTILPRLRLLTVPYAFLAKHSVNANSLVNASNAPVITSAGTNVYMTGTVTIPTVSATTVNAASVVTTPTVNATTVNATTVNASSVVTAPTVTATTVTATTVNAQNGFGTIPIGGIIMWSGSAAPTGWALCDGQTAYGTRTPDLRERFILGTSLRYPPGLTGGNASVTLNTTQLPSHTHRYLDGYHSEAYAPTRTPNDVLAPLYTWYSDAFSGSHGTDDDNKYVYERWMETQASNSSVGPVNILPPFYALAFIMRVQ